jgi:hypothetical protein
MLMKYGTGFCALSIVIARFADGALASGAVVLFATLGTALYLIGIRLHRRLRECASRSGRVGIIQRSSERWSARVSVR